MPWVIYPTGEVDKTLWSSMGLPVYHWTCLHCGHRDDERLSHGGAWARARDHFLAKHCGALMGEALGA